MKTIWILFTVAEDNAFPNFIPLGTYSSKKIAEEQIRQLPLTQQYQLFEFPIDDFIGEVTENGKVKSILGELEHFHFEAEDLRIHT